MFRPISVDLRKIIGIIIGVDLVGLSVFLYGDDGTYKWVGDVVMDGTKYPLYWYFVHGPIALMSVIIFFSGIVLIILSYLGRMNLRLITVVVAVIVSSTLITRMFYLGATPITVMLPLPYKTDEYVIQTTAAWDIIHGVNPYSSSFQNVMLSTLPPQQYTFIYRSGAPYTPGNIVGFVDFFDYLPQAALFYVPAVILNVPGVVWNSLTYSGALTLSFLRMKGNVRYLFPAVIAGSMFIFLESAVMPLPSVGWIAPLLVAVSYPDYPFVAGLMLGWASAYKIYVIPFSVFYLLEARRSGYNVRKMIYGAMISALLPLVPFLIQNPYVVIKDLLAPISLNLRPLDGGPGITDLQFLGVFIPKEVQMGVMLSILIIGIILAMTRKMGLISFIIPAIAFFWYYRPEPQYFMYFPFIGLMAEMTGFFGKLEVTENKNELWMLSSFSVALSAMSVLFLAQDGFPLPTLNTLYLEVGLLLVTALIPLSIMAERFKQFFSRMKVTRLSAITYIYLTLITLVVGIAISLTFNQLYFVVMGHNYESDAFLLSSLAAQEILKGENPYSQTFLHVMLSNPDFGHVFSMIPYPSPVFNGTHPSPVLTPYLNESGNVTCFGERVSYIDFYDYPPGMAVSLLPALLLGVHLSVWETVLYSISVVALFLSVRDQKTLLYLTLGFLSGFFLTFFGEAFESDISPWVSLVLLAIAFRKYPLISGAMVGFDAASMPEASILFPFIAVAVRHEMGSQFFRKFMISSLAMIVVLVVPFLWMDPSSGIEMLFPVIAKLPVQGVGISVLLSLYLFHSHWPIPALNFLTYGVTAISLLVSARFYAKLKETILMLPMFVILTFSRSEIEYFVFYVFLSFLVWAVVTRDDVKTTSSKPHHEDFNGGFQELRIPKKDEKRDVME